MHGHTRLSDRELTSALGNVLSNESVRVVSRTRLRSFHHSIERLELNSDDSSLPRSIILRTYLGSVSWWCQQSADLAKRECFGKLAAKRAAIPIRRVWGTRQTSLGRTLFIEFLEAQPFDELRDSRELLSVAASTLASLHSSSIETDTVAAGDASLKTMLRQLDSWSADLDHPFLRKALFEATDRLDKSVELQCTIHGDCHGGNLLVDRSGSIFMIDWEEAAIGDPRWDVATLMDSIGFGSEAASCFLSEYEQRMACKLEHLSTFRALLLIRNGIVGASYIRARKSGQSVRTDLRKWQSMVERSERKVQQWLQDEESLKAQP